MYINTETLAYPVSEQDIKALYPNTSFPVPFVPPEQYAFVVPTAEPEYNHMTQGVREAAPVLNDQTWTQTWEVYQLTPEQIAINEMNAKQANKTEASQLLAATDWTATVDISDPQYSDPYLGNQDAFLAYRSDVRKIAVNPPIVVDVWPVKPDEVWVEVPAV